MTEPGLRELSASGTGRAGARNDTAHKNDGVFLEAAGMISDERVRRTFISSQNYLLRAFQ